MSRKPKKIKRTRQSKRVVSSKPRIRFPTLERLYTDGSKRALEEYPNLLGIHECSPNIYRQSSDALFRCYGYENMKQRFWDIDKDDYVEHAKSKGNLSGHVSILSDSQGDRPVIFIMRPTEVSNRDHAYGLMIALLFHELGHVDDITHGLHISVNTNVDITAAEAYAHHFACRHIIKQTEYLTPYISELAPDLHPKDTSEWCDRITQFYRVIMAFYIDEILPKYSELPHQSVSEAAKRVLLSSEMAEYRRFAGSAINIYGSE